MATNIKAGGNKMESLCKNHSGYNEIYTMCMTE